MRAYLEESFYPIFFLLFILSFFLIEGEYKFYLFSLWAIFFLFFNFTLHEKMPRHQGSHLKDYVFPRHILFAFFLSGFFLLNVFLSTNIPLSMEKLLFYLVSLSSFVFFSLFARFDFKPKLFFYYLSILTLVLNVLVLLLNFHQEQQNLFSGMNLLVRSYGHNHYAAFLLLVVPVFWWQILFSKRNETKNDENSIVLFSAVLLISSYIVIILSLARLVLWVSLVQLCLIFITNKKVFLSLKISGFVLATAKILIFAFLSMGIFFLLLAVPLNQEGENLCPLIFNHKEMCESLLQNDRFVYWQKAWLIFTENPFFGVGLKNFNFASRKFFINNRQITSYAHNIFLHNMAEGGIITGGFFLFFIAYLFYKSFMVVRSDISSMHKFLWLASLTSLLNAMFDFDWNFFIIFSLSLIYLAIILQPISVYKKAQNEKIVRSYFVVIAAVSLFFALSNAIVFVLNKKDRQDLIIRYFPYMNIQVKELLVEGRLNKEDFIKLYPIYKKNPDFLHAFAFSGGLDQKQKADLQIELANLSPFAFLKNIDFTEMDFVTAEKLAGKFIEIGQGQDYINNFDDFDYMDQRNIALEFVGFADQAYLLNDARLASGFYQKAFLLNEYILHNKKAAFLEDEDFVRASIFLKEFKDFDSRNMHQYWYSYMAFYKKTLLYLFQNNQMEDFFLLSEAMFDQQYNFSWFLWRDLIAVSKTPEEKERLKIIYEHFKDMTTWYDFLPLPE